MLPVNKPSLTEGKYDIYPSYKIKDNQIFAGFETLAEKITDHRIIIIDGYSGAFFDLFQQRLDELLKRNCFSASWVNTSRFFKPEAEIRAMTAPFLGGDDPLFGKKTTLNLSDFFIAEKLKYFQPDNNFDFNIIIGPGASLATWKGLLIYIDIPKNEIQYRSRAGAISNLGIKTPLHPKEMYKCSYFVDWVVLNRHKQKILPSVDIFVDGQRPEIPLWMEGVTLRESLFQMSQNVFRVRPWFEPGVWGGTWIKENIAGLKPVFLIMHGHLN